MKDFLKTGYAKATAAVIAGALVVGTAFGSGLFNDDTSMRASADATKKTETQKTVEKEYPSLLQSDGNAAVDKSETTYVVLDSDGSQKEVVTEEQLTNKDNKDSLEDQSTLSGIENTSGNQKFVQDGNSVTWDAKGKPITYKGTPTSDLPVTVNVSYYLDGEKMSADEIAGKSGNVKIRFDYNVNAKDIENGYTLTHPFTMASGVVLDDQHFSDVSVSNGKAINDGSKTVVLGIAFPGMNSNLGISGSTFSIPDSVVVSAYTDDFEFDGTYTIALSGLMNGTDTSKLDDAESGVETLESSLDELADASNKLTEGADELSDGAKTLKDGTSSLKDGTSTLKDGTGSLKSGTKTLRSGSAEELKGMEELDSGLQKLAANSAALNKATKQIEDTVFDTATTAYQQATKDTKTKLTPENYIQVINNISKSAVSTAEKQLRQQLSTSGVTDESVQNAIMSLAWTDLAAEGKTSPSTAEITSAIKTAAGKAQKAQLVSQGYQKYKSEVVQYLMKAGQTEEEIKSNPSKVFVLTTILALNGGDASKLNDSTALATAAEYVKAANEYENASNNASANVTKLASAALEGSGATKQLSELKSQLDSIEQYVAAVSQYTAGVDSAAAGSSKLVSGMKQINSGIKSLDEGASSLDSGASDLDSGAARLDKGAGTLSDGADTLADSMSKFNREGIQAFVSTLNDAQLADMTGRLKASIDASKKEVFVGGKLSSMTGESRIIFKTGEVKKDK